VSGTAVCTFLSNVTYFDDSMQILCLFLIIVLIFAMKWTIYGKNVGKEENLVFVCKNIGFGVRVCIFSMRVQKEERCKRTALLSVPDKGAVLSYSDVFFVLSLL